MKLARLHRRLAILMSLASLLAFAAGAGLAVFSALATVLCLLLAFFWQPAPELSSKMEKAWLPLALLLVLRALFHVLVVRDDVVSPVVDLLFLLLAAECLRSLDAENDARVYSLSFALLLASTAYRPGLLFLLAFVAYVGLATVTLIVGHLKREFQRHSTGDIPVPRSFLAGALALSGVTLTIAAVVFLVFPRTTRAWAGRGETLATSIAGFADEVALGSHGGRIYGNPQIVLRVEFPSGAPTDLGSLYWRGKSFDRFDGLRWSRSSRLPPAQAPPSWYGRWGTDIIRQRIYGAPLDARVLFALHPLVEVAPESRVQPVTNNAGDHLYWGFGAPSYTALSRAGRPSPEELRNAEGAFAPARAFYTQLPPLSPEVTALADSLMGHLTNDFDRAEALIRWFREEFTYTLDLPPTAREATLENFLLRRRAGHCEYFSTAMAILLRTRGIPTREVNGFLGGSWSQYGSYLAVTQNEAHAWVEVWFPGYGWVPFDPTPPGRGEAFSATSWFWPGRFLFDAIQHRWNKWVLDYSFQSQFNLFELSREAVAEATSSDPQESSGGGGRGIPLVVWVGLTLVFVFLGARLLLRDKTGISQETRTFLRLREEGRRAGIPAPALHSPMSLLRYLGSIQHPAAPATKRLLDRYLQGRFSGLSLREDEEKELLDALAEARTSLRRSPIEV